MNTYPAYRNARRHVERKLGFGIHLGVYLMVNIGLVLLNFLVSPHKVWAVWPLFGWGIGLLFHGLGVFLHAPGTAWKERLIEQEMNKHRRLE
jgi:hypothetical protein